MRGDNYLLAVTTTRDEITDEVKPLFAFPIQVCKATDEKEVKLEIAGPSGAPRAQRYIDTATDELVDDDDCKRGIRVGDEFHEIPDEAIAEINAATKITTMVALGTIPASEIPFERQTGTYYLQSPAKGGSPKHYKLVYEALAPVLKGKKVIRPAQAIVTKRTARSRQKMCVIYADTARKCLVMAEMRFAAQLRDPDEAILAPQIAQIPEAQVEIARKVIDGLGDGMMALDSEVDEAVVLKQALIEQALNGESLTVPMAIGETVASDDLTAMLEASLAQV